MPPIWQETAQLFLQYLHVSTPRAALGSILQHSQGMFPPDEKNHFSVSSHLDKTCRLTSSLQPLSFCLSNAASSSAHLLMAAGPIMLWCCLSSALVLPPSSSHLHPPNQISPSLASYRSLLNAISCF